MGRHDHRRGKDPKKGGLDRQKEKKKTGDSASTLPKRKRSSASALPANFGENYDVTLTNPRTKKSTTILRVKTVKAGGTGKNRWEKGKRKTTIETCPRGSKKVAGIQEVKVRGRKVEAKKDDPVTG